MNEYTLYSDGGSRGNPGPAGIGFVLNHGHVKSCDGGAYIGRETNNVAEYRALIWGLENALAVGIAQLEARADSELMVKQLKGEYKVKNEGLKPLFLEARGLISRFDAVEFVHIPREENEQADSLANDAMDERGEVGSPVLPYQAPSSLFDFTEEESLEEIPANFMCDADEGEESDKPAFDESSENSPLKLSQTQDFSKGSEPVGIYTLTVKDHFDAAHYLYDYPGECRNLHGHTWDIEVSVESTQLCELGMVYDFALLKKDLKAVLARYDHKYLNEIEPFDNISPTAENLARIIFEELSAVITQEGVFVTEVAVWESPIAKLVYKLR